jgi:hypothetical protein
MDFSKYSTYQKNILLPAKIKTFVNQIWRENRLSKVFIFQLIAQKTLLSTCLPVYATLGKLNYAKNVKKTAYPIPF